MTPRRVYLAIGLIAAILSGPLLWYEIDMSAPLIYRDAWYEAVPAAGEKIGQRITEAQPGTDVILALKIEWPRLNCSTEIERRFIGSDNAIYKVPRAADEPARLGPPPAFLKQPDGTYLSRRRVRLPAELPDGVATHSPDVWERCTSPALKWGDHLSEVWPIYVGPKGAEATILIKR